MKVHFLNKNDLESKENIISNNSKLLVDNKNFKESIIQKEKELTKLKKYRIVLIITNITTLLTFFLIEYLK